MKTRIILAALAASVLMAGEAQAAQIYFQDFSNGLNANEQVGGDFAVAGGSVGHTSYYRPNDYSYYQVRLDLTDASSALLMFDFKINSEYTWDGLGVAASTNGVFSAQKALTPTVPELYGNLQGSARDLLGPKGLSGISQGRASFDLSHLVGQTIFLRFQFASDGAVTGDGVDLDNISVTGSIPSAVPEPATWAMMIAGFGMAGSAIRRRRRWGLATA